MKKILNTCRNATLAAVLALFASQASAAVTVGGFTFADNAFADSLISSQGVFTTSGGSLASVLTDIDAGTYAFSRSERAYVELGFVDNLVVNRSGPDLVLFEVGTPDGLWVSLSLGGSQFFYQTAFTGESAGGFGLNAVAIDLNDFGLALDAVISSIVVGLYQESENATVPSLSLVGALNSDSTAVPEPATLALLGLGLAGLAASRRRKC